jgi:hypothetical protein
MAFKTILRKIEDLFFHNPQGLGQSVYSILLKKPGTKTVVIAFQIFKGFIVIPQLDSVGPDNFFQ